MQSDQPKPELTSSVDILERRAWNGARLIILIGPGGAGKTTIASILAPITNRALIDLDREFSGLLGDIDQYIRSKGYPAYKAANSQIAQNLVSNLSGPTILVMSSGFLSLDNSAAVLAENTKLLDSGYCISLLPHADIEIASDIIVDRQLRRGLYKDADRQRQTFRERFALYKAAGDMLVISPASPHEIANAIAKRLVSEGIGAPPLDPR